MIIYTITHIASEKCYVGLTTGRASKRWLDHIACIAGDGENSSTRLTRCMKKYGVTAFSFEVLDSAKTRDELARKEVFWIAQLRTLSPNGLNLTSGGDLGAVYSEETRRKIGAAHKGKTLSPEVRAKISDSLKGKKLSAETIAKRTASVLGQKRSEETKARISAGNKGKVCSSEARERISLAKRGVKQDPAVVEKRAAPLRGRKHPADAVAHRAALLRGQKRTYEQCVNNARAKMKGKVVSCSNGKIYGSVFEAAADTGVGRSSINNACAGTVELTGGMGFSYAYRKVGVT